MQAYRRYRNHRPRMMLPLWWHQWLTVTAIQLRASFRRRVRVSRAYSVTNTQLKII